MDRLASKKIWIVGSLLALVVVLAIWNFTAHSAIAVETVILEEKNYVDTFREDGTLVSNLQRPIYTEVNGIVEKIHYENGDRILVGDVLVELSADDLKFSIDALKGQLISVKGQLSSQYKLVKSPDLSIQKSAVKLARSNYDKQVEDERRAAKLYESGALSLSSYETSQNLLVTLEQRLNIENNKLESLYSKNNPSDGTIKYYEGQIINLESEIARMENQLDKTVIISEVSGVLSDQNLKVGQVIQTPTHIGNIISTENMKVEALVLTKESLGIHLGQRVEIIRDRNGIEDKLLGEIVRMSPNAMETLSALGLKERRIKVEIKVQEGHEVTLIPGSDVDVYFTAYENKSALILPKSAVFKTAGGDAVWLVKEKKVLKREIVKGYESAREIEVIDGLEAGDLVLKHYDSENIEVGTSVKSN